jgi:MFS transporter, DHA2 family, methylenomycin A resistance protein
VFAAYGVGMGFSIAPTNAAAMGSVQRQRSGIASGTVNAARQAGNTLGIAILGSVLVRGSGFVGGLHHVVVIAGVVTLLAAALAARG